MLASVLLLPLTLALWLAKIDVPLLLGYMLPFFYAVTSQGTSAIPIPMAGAATLAECTCVVLAYSYWLRRVGAKKSTFAGALVVVLVMAITNYLWMAALGLSVMPTHANLRT